MALEGFGVPKRRLVTKHRTIIVVPVAKQNGFGKYIVSSITLLISNYLVAYRTLIGKSCRLFCRPHTKESRIAQTCFQKYKIQIKYTNINPICR